MLLADFIPKLKTYLGIEQRQTKIKAYVNQEKERRADPVYVEQRKMRRALAKEKDRYENEVIIGEVMAEYHGDPQWDDIRIVKIKPDFIPIINKALRTPKKQVASLRTTLLRDLVEWDEYGYVAKSKQRHIRT